MFRKEVSNAKGGKAESYRKIKDINWKLAQGEDEVRGIWKKYFEDMYNIDTQEQVQSTCVALMRFGEETTSEERNLEELRLR